MKHFCQDLSHIVLAVDDTTCLRKGKNVFGKAKHRDGVRSSHAVMIPMMGHKWVVISIVVKLRVSSRHWALPVAVGLCKSSDFAMSNNTRHKTPAHIARLLVARIQRKFSTKKFIVVGDQGFGGHRIAKFISGRGACLVSKFLPDAVLHSLPQARNGKVGRPQTIKGTRMPRPRDTVAAAEKMVELEVTWYGGGPRKVAVVSGVGHWFRRGDGLLQIKWVFVRDLSGTHRDEYFYSTNVNLSAEDIISLYTSRWAIEVTFQECKAHLRIEKSAVWCEQSVLTLVPMLFATYSVIVLLASQFTEIVRTWPGKKHVTFSDMVLTLRRNIWKTTLFPNSPIATGSSEISEKRRESILTALCQTG